MRQPMRMVVLGDSVTAGFGLAPGQENCRYPKLLADHFTVAGLDVQLIESALDGVDSAYALQRFSRLVTAHDPDWVLVMLGLNDAVPAGNRQPISPEGYRQNMLGLVDRTMSLGATSVLVSPNPRYDSQGVELMQPYVSALETMADGVPFAWVNMYRHFVADRDLSELIPDCVHPSALGHKLIADVLGEKLPTLFAQPALFVRPKVFA